jgi:hypothetical protein
MDWKQFFASITGSIMWPTAVVTIVLIFRKEVARLLRQAKKLGAAGIHLEVAEQVAAARNSAAAVHGEQSGQSTPAKLDPAFMELAKSFPEAAVLHAYKELERVLQQIEFRLSSDRPHRTSVEVVQALYEKGEISQNVVRLFEDLRQAKNSAAHARGDGAVTPGEAIELAEQAKMLTELFQTILDGMPHSKIEKTAVS